jgi:Protein of unknown function (DUF3606)
MDAFAAFHRSTLCHDGRGEREVLDGVCPWEDAMDSLTKKQQPDRSKINLHQPHEVKYWTHALKVTPDELRKAVDKVGNSAAAVRKELGMLGEAHR